MSINLLPWRQLKRSQRHKKLMYRMIIYIVFLFFLSVMIKLFFYVELRQTHSKIDLLNRQIVNISLHDPLHANESLLKKLIYFHAQQKLAQKLNDSIQAVLFHIANVIPSSIILDQLIIDSKKIVLIGNSNQLADIHHYVNALHTEKISPVQLTNIQTDEKLHSLMRFTIEISLKEQKHAVQRTTQVLQS